MKCCPSLELFCLTILSLYIQPRSPVPKADVSLQYTQKAGDDPSNLQILLSIPLF